MFDFLPLRYAIPRNHLYKTPLTNIRAQLLLPFSTVGTSPSFRVFRAFGPKQLNATVLHRVPWMTWTWTWRGRALQYHIPSASIDPSNALDTVPLSPQRRRIRPSRQSSLGQTGRIKDVDSLQDGQLYAVRDHSREEGSPRKEGSFRNKRDHLEAIGIIWNQ